jgi:hypothetical protein
MMSLPPVYFKRMENSESGLTSKDPIGSSSLAHARYLHGSGNGKVTVGYKTDLEPPDHWNQTSYSVE